MRLLKLLSWTCVALISAVLLGASGAYLYLSPGLPSVETLRNVRMQVPLRIYSADDKLIAEFGEMRRSPIHFSDIPRTSSTPCWLPRTTTSPIIMASTSKV